MFFRIQVPQGYTQVFTAPHLRKLIYQEGMENILGDLRKRIGKVGTTFVYSSNFLSVSFSGHELGY